MSFARCTDGSPEPAGSPRAGVPALTSGPGRTLLPRLGPFPGSRWPVVLTSLSAAIVVLSPSLLHLGRRIPGHGSEAGVAVAQNRFWLAAWQPLHALGGSRAQYAPYGANRLTTDGYPLDALLASPLEAAGGPFVAYTLFLLVVLWGNGVTAGWLAGRWWRSTPAALVGGLIWQLSGWTAFQLSSGGTDTLLAALLVPLVLGGFLDALLLGRMAAGLTSGLLAALCVVASFDTGFYLALALTGVVLVALFERPRLLLRIVPFLATATLVVFPALLVAFTLYYAQWKEVPGLWTALSRTDPTETLGSRVNETGVGLSGLVRGPLAVPAAVVMLGPLACFRVPLRRWLLPLGWLLAGLWTASGAWHVLGGLRLPTPLAGLLSIRLPARPEDPREATFLVLLGGAVLVAGGARRLCEGGRARARTAALAALVAAEALARNPRLPVPTLDTATPTAPCMEPNGEGTVLHLPLGASQRAASHPLLAQVHHGRPVVNGPVSFARLHAPPGVHWWNERDALVHLAGCEQERGRWIEPETARAQRFELAAAGVTEVVLDTSPGALPPESRQGYCSCIQRLLGPPDRVAPRCERYLVTEEPAE